METKTFQELKPPLGKDIAAQTAAFQLLTAAKVSRIQFCGSFTQKKVDTPMLALQVRI